jgi:Cys-tRNA(Pro)/Cys-tRNA(Cys) deacylase
MAKTPAIQAAERAGIAFDVLAYAHDPAAPSYGLEAAERLGLDPASVFKTLLVTVEGLPGALAVGIVPVTMQLDLKAMAQAAGGKRAEMADPKVAERATGYVLGGISPLGQKRRLPTVIDETAVLFERVHVSAGRRGLEIALAPGDLLALTAGTLAAIGR